MKNEIVVVKKLLPDATIAEDMRIAREAFRKITTLRQKQLIYTFISLVRSTDDRFTMYEVPFRQITSILNPANPDSKRIKEDVIKAIEGIMDTSFRLPSKDKSKIFIYHWVESACIDLDNNKVFFKLSDEVREFYLDLQRGNYTAFKLNEMCSLSSVFQTNVFSWCNVNSGFDNSIKISIDNAKKIFDINTDIRTDAFITKLNTAVKRINERTSLNVSYNAVKEGRNIDYLEFRIKNNYIKEN